MEPRDTQPGEQASDLLDAVTTLTAQVGNLSRQVTVSQDQADQTKRATRLAVAVAVVSLVLTVAVTVLVLQVRDNAKTSCENANESRAANLTLWTFVLDASAASNPDRSPEQEALVRGLREWIAKLYAPRDCSDLSRKYELPPPPTLSPRP